MKKISTLILIALTINANAFDYLSIDKKGKDKNKTDEGVKRKIIISAGVGFNRLKELMINDYEKSYFDNKNGQDYRVEVTKQNPMFNFAVDYGIAKKISVGLAFGYQTIEVYWGDPVIYFNQDEWKCTHFALRGDYHIIADKRFDLYTGAKFGYNSYQVTRTSPGQYAPYYTSYPEVHPIPVSAQAHLGVSYFFGGIIGFNAEGGIGYGGPYFFAAGITAKF